MVVIILSLLTFLAITNVITISKHIAENDTDMIGQLILKLLSINLVTRNIAKKTMK